MMFHHDMIHAEVPSKGTLLYSVEIPSAGGDTLFASGYAAYDSLDPAVRDKLEGRKAISHYDYGSTQKGDSRGTEAFGECTHPVFRTHEDTGKKAVYVNRLMTTGVVDMPPEESAPLLGKVFDHAERPEFVYEHVWRLGDLLLWDNRCSSHARTDFPLDRTPADAAHHGEGHGAAVLKGRAARKRPSHLVTLRHGPHVREFCSRSRSILRSFPRTREPSLCQIARPLIWAKARGSPRIDRRRRA